jgi:hypothetical protein
MPLTIKRPQFRHPFGYESAEVNVETVREVLEYLFNTTAWKTNQDALPRKVRQWRERLFASNTVARIEASAVASDDGPTDPASLPYGVASPPPTTVAHTHLEVAVDSDWVVRAMELKRQGMGWTRISQEVLRPRATVRRLVEKEFAERGEPVPSGVRE